MKEVIRATQQMQAAIEKDKLLKASEAPQPKQARYYQELVKKLSDGGSGESCGVCITQTKDQVRSHLERVIGQLEMTRVAMEEMRAIQAIKRELMHELRVPIPQVSIVNDTVSFNGDQHIL